MQANAISPAMHTTVASPESMSQSDVIKPMAVESGFVLWSPGRIGAPSNGHDYKYWSDWFPITEEFCVDGSCSEEDQLDVQLVEWVQGGTSKLWELSLYAEHAYGSEPVSFDYWYGCAINVSGNPDHYCQNKASGSGATGVFNSGDTLYKYFENNTYNNIEYPMVRMGVQFEHAYASAPFRGWDTCAGRLSYLCGTSGTGN